MKFFALIGAFCVMLAAGMVIALPAVLAFTVSLAWLWVYVGYAVAITMFACVMAGSRADDLMGRSENKGDE